MIDTETTSGTSAVLSPSEKINLEISSYLDIPTLEMDADSLAWWKFENSRFQIWLYSPESIYGFVELVFHLKGV